MLPSRFPRAGGSTVGYGYRLRLPNGPAVEDDDPLLKAFGAAVEWLEYDADDEQLQLDVFDPGRRLRLTGEPLGEEATVLDACRTPTAMPIATCVTGWSSTSWRLTV